jgi:hypothetical protein
MCRHRYEQKIMRQLSKSWKRAKVCIQQTRRGSTHKEGEVEPICEYCTCSEIFTEQSRNVLWYRSHKRVESRR